ncbi:MAG: leucine-rich repeat domain-containing protein [Gammaproteobacteria bacterium]|nr:leucine-rich repeat domain-containing protein [Gammaproteobacteria bacterium]
MAAGAFPAPTQAYGGDRKVVFECPCSAEFRPGTNGGAGTLTLHFGLRSHRDVRSAGVMVRMLRRDEGGTLWSRQFLMSDILPQSPMWEHGVPAAQAVRRLSHSVRFGPLQMGDAVVVQLVEADGDLSSSDPSARWNEVASAHEWLTLWPVPGGDTDATTRYVDILTDSDSGGVGDVNERIAGTDPDDPASTPGASEVDVLWLYQASLAEPDAVPEYHHAAVVANAIFTDSGTNLRLRSVGFASVDDGDIDESGDVKQERLDELLDRHGADAFNFWYDNQDGIEDPCPEGSGGCARLGDQRGRGGWIPAPSRTSVLLPTTIAHELGHVMGLAHSARQAESHGSFRWSRGHYVGEWGPRPHYGTIMSYGIRTLTPVFSSPTSNRCRPLGACGLPATHPHGANAARSLDLVRFQVADVRGPKPDSDGDGFVDAADAFPNDPSDWADLDGDGIGDNADRDADGDGRADADDAFPHDADEWADLDGDGVGDNADADRDGDGVANDDDLFPDDALDHADADGDGVGDNAQRLHPFRDANLRAVVESALGKAEGQPISDAEIAGLGALEADDADISDLTGLELATGLTKLRLGMDERGNRSAQAGGVADLNPLIDLEALETVGLATSPRLADLLPLAGLRNLKSLRLSGAWGSPPSEVSDLRALESLPLTQLAIRQAIVSDASPLSGLAQLESLDLANNRIVDISSLSGLSQLRSLNLWINDVSDISPLAGLSELTWLAFGYNRIADISPLAGLSKLRNIQIRSNIIADISPLAGLSLLSYLHISENGIEDVSVLGGLAGLSNLQLNNNRIADASPLTALTGLHGLGIGGNPLSFTDFLAAFQPGPDFQRLGLPASNIDDLAPLAGFMERTGARAWDLDLSSNPFTDLSPLVRSGLWDGGGQVSLRGVRLDREAAEAQVAELESMGVTVIGYDPGTEDAPKAVDIPDARMGRLLQEAVAASSFRGLVDDPVTQDSAARITEFHAFGQGIADLTGLEAATGLEYAHLASNRISDLSPLLGLERLKGVDLDGNPLTETALNEQVPELLAQVAAASCESGEAACGTVILNAVSWTPVAGSNGTARIRTGGYFAAKLEVADASEITFAASADREALGPSVSADGLLRIRPARLAGPATITVTAEAEGTDPAALDFHIVSPKPVPLFLADGAASGRHGFLRVVNHSGRAGDVRITARDGSGAAFGPVMLPLEGHQAIHLNSHDLENGNPAKGLREGLGDGQGDWRLTMEGRLNAEALAYVRTQDGFVTAMHDIAPKEDEDRELLFFNPGSNHRQESVLQLINGGDGAEAVRITGIDDAGSEGAVTVDLPAGESLRFTAAELESGAAPGLSGALGDGTGKWRLRIEARPDVTAMGLLETPSGHLANLSASPPAHDADGIVRIPLFLSASEPSREGFMRVVNRSDSEGAIAISAFDGMGEAYGPVSLSLGPRESQHFNSGDLEAGNPAKGLDGSTGAGSGNWRLELDGGGLDFEALAYVRTNDGFVTAMHEVAPDAGGGPRIAFLNPGSNYRQESVLRLANPSDASTSITITAIDDAGRAGGAPITLELPAGRAVALTAKALEDGADGLSGSMGDGRGKWRLCVGADRPVTAMSLLETPTGHLTNMSASPDLFDCAEAD